MCFSEWLKKPKCIHDMLFTNIFKRYLEKNLTCFEGKPGTFYANYNYVVIYCDFPLLAYSFIPFQGEGVAASCSPYKRIREKPTGSHMYFTWSICFYFALEDLFSSQGNESCLGAKFAPKQVRCWERRAQPPLLSGSKRCRTSPTRSLFQRASLQRHTRARGSQPGPPSRCPRSVRLAPAGASPPAGPFLEARISSKPHGWERPPPRRGAIGAGPPGVREEPGKEAFLGSHP